jgi:seryl-tRNA synthetase
LATTLKQARLQRAKELQLEMKKQSERKKMREEREKFAEEKSQLEKRNEELAAELRKYIAQVEEIDQLDEDMINEDDA